jgi:hypothetical protein
VFENAKTLDDVDKLKSGTVPAISAGELPRSTSTGTAALPALPVSRPGVFWVAAGALALGAVGTTLFVTNSARSAAEVPVVASAAPPSTTTATADPPPVTSASPVSVPDPPPKAAVATNPPRTVVPGKTQTAAHPPAAGSPPPSGSFSIVTASANPAVLRATGVSASDVRAALPAAKFTQCYRGALERTGKRLEGHITLSMNIDPTGIVNRVNIMGPPSLLTNAGTCVEDAMNQLPVRHSSDMGATADIDIACVPGPAE